MTPIGKMKLEQNNPNPIPSNEDYAVDVMLTLAIRGCIRNIVSPLLGGVSDYDLVYVLAERGYEVRANGKIIRLPWMSYDQPGRLVDGN